MNYNPFFLDKKEILTENEKNHLHGLNKKINFDILTQFRNSEEFGIDFVYNSSQLEGNTYSKIDTANLIKLGQTAAGKLYSDATMILNLRKSFDFLLANLDRKEIDKDFIKDNHAILSNNLVPFGMSGVVRKSEVLINESNYRPLTNPQKLDSELDYLISIANMQYDDPFEKSIYLHNNLAYLQYFIDVNKRTARNTSSFALMQNKVFPCLYHLSDSNDYITTLIEYYETGLYKNFKSYFISSYEKTALKYEMKPDPEIYRENFKYVNEQSRADNKKFKP